MVSPLSSLPSIAGYSGISGKLSGASAGNAQTSPRAEYQAGRATDEKAKVGGLSETELKELTELKSRDREVRAHEAAHQAAGGQHSGAMSLTYQRGPDGAQYAVGGEVAINVSAVNGDPQATIEKMRVVRAAAMAPAQPSGQDRAVAAQAMQVMLQAQSELALERSDSGQQEKSTTSESENSEAASESVSGSGESASEPLPMASEQARATYQNVAGFGLASTPSGKGFLPVSA